MNQVAQTKVMKPSKDDRQNDNCFILYEAANFLFSKKHRLKAQSTKEEVICLEIINEYRYKSHTV